MKTCEGCKTEHSDEVWLHSDLKICSICFSIHVHSKVKFWNPKTKKWQKRAETLERWL